MGRTYSRPYVLTMMDGTKEVRRILAPGHGEIGVFGPLVGPFKTVAGANFWAASPTPLTVAQAERGAKNAELAALAAVEKLAA